MNNKIEESDLNDENQTLFFSSPIGMFVTKTFIIFAAIYFLLESFNPFFGLNERLKKLETNENKYILLSFIQNPRVLLELSKYHEDKGKFDQAQREMTAAIGLLELHGAKKETINFYNKRLLVLKNKDYA